MPPRELAARSALFSLTLSKDYGSDVYTRLFKILQRRIETWGKIFI